MIDRETDPVGWELRHQIRGRELYLDWAMGHPYAKPWEALTTAEKLAWTQEARKEERHDRMTGIPFVENGSRVVYPRWQDA